MTLIVDNSNHSSSFSFLEVEGNLAVGRPNLTFLRLGKVGPKVWTWIGGLGTQITWAYRYKLKGANVLSRIFCPTVSSITGRHVMICYSMVLHKILSKLENWAND